MHRPLCVCVRVLCMWARLCSCLIVVWRVLLQRYGNTESDCQSGRRASKTWKDGDTLNYLMSNGNWVKMRFSVQYDSTESNDNYRNGISVVICVSGIWLCTHLLQRNRANTVHEQIMKIYFLLLQTCNTLFQNFGNYFFSRDICNYKTLSFSSLSAIIFWICSGYGCNLFVSVQVTNLFTSILFLSLHGCGHISILLLLKYKEKLSSVRLACKRMCVSILEYFCFLQMSRFIVFVSMGVKHLYKILYLYIYLY